MRAAALGLIQGIAEVVPVSSSAQLTLLPWLVGAEPAGDRTTLAAGLHAGSCAGIAWSLRSELPDRRTTGLVALSSVPAALAGLLAGEVVERRLGRPGPTAGLLALAGLALWAADHRPEDVAAVGAREATVAGLAQVLALAPGVSRSGATLTALRLLRVDAAAASRFSILMSLPITAGAAGLTLLRNRHAPAGELAVGIPVAAVTSALAARSLLRPGVRPARAAAVYRLGLAAAVAVRLHRNGNR